MVVPSQELASQVHQVFLSLTHGTQLRAGLVSEEATLVDPTYYPLASTVDILIITPVQLTHYLDRYTHPHTTHTHTHSVSVCVEGHCHIYATLCWMKQTVSYKPHSVNGCPSSWIGIQYNALHSAPCYTHSHHYVMCMCHHAHSRYQSTNRVYRSSCSQLQ